MSALEEDWKNIDEGVPAFVVQPQTTEAPWPGLIIIHSVIGIDQQMLDLARSFGKAGYLAVIPSLYANDPGYKLHQQGHIELAAHMGPDPARHAEFLARHSVETQNAIRRAREWISGRPVQTYINAVISALKYLQGRPDVREIGAFGFCMGGRLVGELAATGADFGAGVIHYGSPPPLDLVPRIKAPLEGHYASTDTPITGKIPAFAEAMNSAGKEFAYYIYDGDHGFSLADNNPTAKRASMNRSRAFLDRHLQPSSSTSLADQ